MLAQSYGSNSNIRELRQSRDLIFAIEEALCDRSPKCMFKTVFLSPFPPLFLHFFVRAARGRNYVHQSQLGSI